MLASRYSMHCLHFAASQEDTTVAVILISELDYSVATKDNTGRTPLHTAAYYGNVKMVRLLVERFDASTSAKDDDGKTPLAIAVSYKQHDVTKWLVSIGANVNISDKQEWTSLHDAVNRG